MFGCLVIMSVAGFANAITAPANMGDGQLDLRGIFWQIIFILNILGWLFMALGSVAMMGRAAVHIYGVLFIIKNGKDVVRI